MYKRQILIYEDILEAERVKTEADITPITQELDMKPSSKEEMLKKLKNALQKAVDEEDYERAAQLRDLINQQK